MKTRQNRPHTMWRFQHRFDTLQDDDQVSTTPHLGCMDYRNQREDQKPSNTYRRFHSLT